MSDKYYHEYGSYNHFNSNNADYSLLLVMGTLILLSICCLFMIIAMVCGFISGKFYQTKQNHQRKHDADPSNAVNVNQDRI